MIERAWTLELKFKFEVRHGPNTSFQRTLTRGGFGIAYSDSDGNPFDGNKTYKVNLPAPVPVKDFWCFTLYDNQTRSMLQTDQQFPGIDGNKEGLQKNSDGSVDVYIGPKAPAGRESNWIQSAPGKGWNTILRLYGPLEPWFDKTWKPGDFELVE